LYETDDIDHVFQIIDSDKSGFIDKDELREIFVKFILPDKVDLMITLIMDTIDIDENGMID